MKTKFLLLIALLIVVFTEKNNAQSGLIGCYPLNNNANDFSGNGYNGTAYNVTPTTSHLGVINGAYHFSGSGSYISIPVSGYQLDSFTYSVWCNPDTTPAVDNGFAIIAIGGSSADQLMNLDNDVAINNIGFSSSSFSSSLSGYHCAQGFLPTLHQWYHVVMTRDNTTLNLYVNGSLICSTSSGGTTAGYAGNTITGSIGSRETSSFQNFMGDIDDVRIFNRVLSLSEIQNMDSACVAVLPTCLVACYPLANNANDYSGNNYNGTAYNVTPATSHLGVTNGAYHFSGSGSYISIPVTGYLLDSFTYSVWCNPDTTPAVDNGFAIIAIGGSSADQLMNLDNDVAINNIGFSSSSFSSTLSGYHCAQGFLPTLHQWYHVVMTRDNTTLNLYVNGSLICSTGSGGTTAGYAGNTISGAIGSRETSSFQNFMGDIDDVRIYNCVLSATEIQNMSASCTTTITGIDDLSGNDHSLIMYPNPLTSSSTLQLNTQVKNAEVIIYDVLGKEMMRKKLSGDKMEIEKGSLVSGVYFVRVVSEERQWVEKMVVE